MAPFVETKALRAFLPRLQANLASRALQKTPAGVPPPRASVAAVFRWKEQQQQTLEVLFIRRSFNERDTWSGQVAFPGGKRQKKAVETDSVEWETSLETAHRETLEEIGLDLTQPHVHWIGTLPPIQTHLRTFWVGTEVFFIDSSADKHAFTPVIQDSEIANVFWVDLQELYNPKRYQRLLWPVEGLVDQHPRLRSLVKRVLGELTFGSIYLPRPTHAPPDDDMSLRSRHDFILWGLTMRMLADICELAELPLPDGDISPRFDKKQLGDLFLLLYRRPDQAIKPGLALAALGAMALGLYSQL
ncbi:hypothetical protein Poli38472_011109 [Pythium oligandrum]|uniref:Nudix hydrolase domain-containing protein n=1 Tax=Pythium oligandrum TaxID=41045 RepID=A0A8K1CQP2_PYTOL|nr:hypothetical protein Poli38472_011109 [Pythium oligandrum]|eukprot:TMW67489.1 hypothetical protein Poli38472_011109 [Pythium oligandrum]